MGCQSGFEKLFIFEMANNHGGDLSHGIKIIRELKDVCSGFDFQFAVKLQYRDIDTFIHPLYKARHDMKYIKRFMETRLKPQEFKALKDEIKACGFLAVCTPFDEPSVDLVEKHGFDMIKIASCSLTDWPLLERVAKTEQPLIVSTAAASMDDLDKVVLFLKNRDKKLALMHCVGEYPTADDRLRMGRIDVLRQRYPQLPIGFSTHESPDHDVPVQVAIAKGACVFEKHVGIKDAGHDLNPYSATPRQAGAWLRAAAQAFRMCSDEGVSKKEQADLKGLQRGVFARSLIQKGEKVALETVFFAIPQVDGQVLANDLSKYTELVARRDVVADAPVMWADFEVRHVREEIVEIMRKIRELVMVSHVVLPNRFDLELSHHYGIERFEECGAAIINCINREYCKKFIILLPGQEHPVHHHLRKEETFNVLFGELVIDLGGTQKVYRPGDMLVVERGQKHAFSSATGVIFEEISTTHGADDSFYDDPEIMQNKARKTTMAFWHKWMNNPAN